MLDSGRDEWTIKFTYGSYYNNLHMPKRIQDQRWKLFVLPGVTDERSLPE